MGYQNGRSVLALSFLSFFILSSCGVNNSSLSESLSESSEASSSSSQASSNSSPSSSQESSSSESSSSESSSSSSEEASSSSESSSVSSSSEESSSSSSQTAVTLSFETNGGSLVNPISGLSGSYISQPSSPYRNGFTFAGWYAEEGLSTPFVFSTLPDQSMTVYADWQNNGLVFTDIGNNQWSVCGNTLNDPTEIWVPKYYQGKLVTAIDDLGFSGQRYAILLKLPDSISQIGFSAFSGLLACTSICVFGQSEHYQTIDGSLYTADGKTLIRYPNGLTHTEFLVPFGVETIGMESFDSEFDLTSVTLPTTVKVIEDEAFMWCMNLAAITMNEGLESIGANAFYASGLTSVVFPSTLTLLSASAFDSAYRMASYSVAAGNTVFSSYDGNLYSHDLSVLRRYAVGKTDTSFALPPGVTSIGPSAFREAKNLTTITLSSGLISIFSEAFRSCYGLTSVTLPDTLVYLGNYAFQYCNNLPGIFIPESVDYMGHWVFDGCTAIHIYVEASLPGTSWDVDWNASKPVTWAYGG